MKTTRRARWTAVLLFVTVAGWAAEAEMEFNGVKGSGREHQLLLKAKSGEAQWVSVGKSFGGYTITSYEPKDETATLTKDGRVLRVRLRDAKTVLGGGASAGLTPEIKAGITRNLRMISAAADQYFLETGKTTVSPEVLLEPDKYIKGLEVLAGENYRTLEIAQGKPLKVTTPSGHTVSYLP
jgi:hypothetical protein